MHRYAFSLEPIAPFQYTPHLERFTVEGRPTPFIWLRGKKLLRLAVRVNKEFTAVDAFFTGEPWSPRVQLVVHTENRRDAVEARNKFAAMIRSSLDYKHFIEAVRGVDKRLYRLASRYPGLRPGRCMSLYAALMDSVVKQRISLQIALRIYSRLVENYGAKVAVGDTTYYWHPLPEKLIEARVDELRGQGLTRVKARTLKEIAQAKLEERLPSIEEAIKDPDNTARELTRLYGVGPWTAQLAIAMVHPSFPLGPTSDLAVKRGLATILDVDEEKADSIAEKIREHIPGYSGLVLYLAAYEHETQKKTRNIGATPP